MRSKSFALVLVPAALATVCSAQSVQQPLRASPIGTWVNPSGSVKVATGECGDKLCGWVVWADGKAQADARDAGVPNLMGTMLLQNYHQTDPDRWQGRVYVPDMGGIYFSRIQQLGDNQLKISGCILGGLLCKSQIWRKA